MESQRKDAKVYIGMIRSRKNHIRSFWLTINLMNQPMNLPNEGLKVKSVSQISAFNLPNQLRAEEPEVQLVDYF